MNGTPHPLSLEVLLSPASVALVGISGDESQNSARPLRFMRAHGYDGRIYPVNPKWVEVFGERCYASVAELPETPDVALLMVGAKRVHSALEDCARAGVRHAIVYAGGFADEGAGGRHRQQELVARARELDLRLLGPNSIGIANTHTGAIVSVNAVFEMSNLPKGGAGFVSQSGSMMGSLLSRAAARGVGFSKSISVGNEADITVGEVVDALVDDALTRVILLFLETIRDHATLAHALERARAAGKPVIAYKLGQSPASDLLTMSHTGAIAGDRACVDAFFRRHGVMRVGLLETLFEIAPLAQRYGTSIEAKRGRRVAVVTTTGGGAAAVVDNFALRGLEVVAPPLASISQLHDSGVDIKPAPIIDLTLSATREQFHQVLVHLLEADWCDAVLSVVGSSAQFHPGLAVQPMVEASPRAIKPLVAFLAPEAPDSLRLLHDSGIAAFRTPEGCADALATFLSRPADVCASATEPLAWPRHLPVSGMLSECEAADVFERVGIPVVQWRLLTEGVGSHSLPYPVVAKIASRDIPHKSDIGGVQTGIRSDDELRDAITLLLANARANAPSARVDGVLVQSHEQGLAELLIGFRRDPVVGPVVVLGAGGIAAEVLDDTAVRMAPVSEEEAFEMLGELRIGKLVDGYRGRPSGNSRAIAQAVAAMSRLYLVKGATVVEAEINPLLVKPQGVVAVDALLRLTDSISTTDTIAT